MASIIRGECNLLFAHINPSIIVNKITRLPLYYIIILQYEGIWYITTQCFGGDINCCNPSAVNYYIRCDSYKDNGRCLC